MKISNALKCALAADYVVSSTGLRATASRKLQQHESLLDYQPATQVTDVAALDLDQIALETLLPLETSDALAQALSVYTLGGFSASYAKLTLSTPISTAIDFDLPVGTLVSGASFGNRDIQGELMAPLTGGQLEVFVKYETQDEQRSYVGCQVGGSPDPILDGCFASVGEIVLGNPDDKLTFTFTYEYDVLTDNMNARTLQSLSTSAKENLYDCAKCPYSTYQKFYNYYNQFDYGNEWIMAAFERRSTNFMHGNANFSAYTENGSPGIVEAVRKGTVFLNVYMEVIKSMENAVDKCEADADDIIQSWDEAVAFYVGSMSKVTNGDDGNFLYTNAKRRCRGFGTCDSKQGTDGEALSNAEIFNQFTAGQDHLIGGECEQAKAAKNRIIDLMSVPLVQGTIRFAYLMDYEGIVDDRADVTSAAYAASILPLVHSCSPVDAQILYSNMKVGANSVNFTEVKSALERNYMCMGLTCSDIGGLLSEDGEYVEDGEPCDDEADTMASEADTMASEADTMASEGEVVETEVPVNSTVVDTSATPIATDAPTSIATILNSTWSEEESAVSSSCPPCSHTPVSESVAASKTLSDCAVLVDQQKEAIGKGCVCACFVDSEYAFCAQETITYTGSGTIVGPCDVELPDSLIEAEDVTDAEDFTASNTENVIGSTAEANDDFPEVDPNDLDVAAAQDESSGRVLALGGIAVSVFAVLFMTLS